MYKLSYIIFFLTFGMLFAQSPHGENFNYDCAECHSTNTWKIDIKKLDFDHAKTGFELAGQHAVLDCQTCHSSLDFVTTKNKCFDCHNDIHQNTLEKDCQQCHNSNNWLVENINEIHNAGRFPLLGAHITADCQQCHKSIENLVFEQLGVECEDCHSEDYMNTQNPDHVTANFSKDCEQCHSVTDLQWRTAKFAHDFFPLTLGHKISNCFDCHNTQSFEGLSQDCYSCHQENFTNTTDPNHINSDFSHDCVQCHTTNPGWKPADFKAHDQVFALLGAHNKIRNNCAKCHSTGYSGTPTDCFSCHETQYNQTSNPVHSSTGFGTDCESCHNVNAWTPATFDHDNQFFPIYSGKHNNKWDNCSDCHENQNDYSQFTCLSCHEHSQSKMDDEHSGIDGYSYESQACLTCHPQGDKEGAIDHSKTAFPLTGAHQNADCSQCHATGYSGTPIDCFECHQDSYTNAANPKHTDAGISNKCEDCHNTSVWKPSTFNHSSTGFDLIGGHQLPQCSSCHQGSTTDTSPLCFNCHQDQYNNAENHVAQNYPTTCEQCHNSTTWDGADFDHNNTNFALTGAHQNTDCNQCHTNGYAGTPTDCNSCHSSDFQNTTNPNHSGLSLSNNCEVCHSTDPGWKPAKFPVHNDFYMLNGAHASISDNCATCHNGDYNNTPNTCYGCHQTDYENTNDPPHQTTGFGNDCESCHSETAWKPSTFDHDNQYFPIYSGKHNNKWDNCSDCHENQNDYSQFTCLSCHEHSQTKMDDKHNGIDGYAYESQACLSCHPQGDKEGAIDHSKTAFPLTGAHQNADCSQCHSSGYANTPLECFACHENKFTNAANPKHTDAGISTKCEDCHNTTDWKPSTFNHSSTGFDLIGGHQLPQCSSCHQGSTSDTSPLCYSCHQDQYNNAENHASQSYPTTCEQCHNTTDWKDANFDHANTDFPLTGAHQNTDCDQCHTNGYTGTPSDCNSCHNNDYQNTTNPDHNNLGLSNQCETCHTTDPGWKPADFPVHNDYYVLNGAHAAISDNCATCHNGDYNNTPNTCYGCHQTDYENTNDPPHQSNGFSTDCESCHTENAWKPSTFDHDNQYFPIYSGKHNNKWDNCSDCHENQNDYSQFTCLSCHEHSQTKMDDKHKEVSGYAYDSNACYDCHPNGKEDGGIPLPVHIKRMRD